jgi:N-acetyl-anhydromuramyl-L-alanine amidase AmpD
VKLVAWLAQEHKVELANIRGHKDAAPGQTSCPGRDFYRYLEDGQFKKWVMTAMKGENPQVAPGPSLPNGPTTNISEAGSTR